MWRSNHTEQYRVVARPSLAVIATQSSILRSSSALTECAYSPKLGRRFNLLPRITEGRGLACKELAFVLSVRLLASDNRYDIVVLCPTEQARTALMSQVFRNYAILLVYPFNQLS